MTRHSSIPGLVGALASAAVLLVACSDGAENATATSQTPSQAASETPSETPSPTESPTPSGPDGWTPLSKDGDEELPPGRYGLTYLLPELPWAVVDVPRGFGNFVGWAVLEEGGSGLGYSTVTGVYRHPCEVVDYVDVGDSVEDLASAFEKQKLTRVTAPTPVTVDGYQGLYLELHVSKDVDFSECGRNYYLWYSKEIGDRYVESPGFERVWILDVEGDVVALHAPDGSDVSQDARDTITEMVESLDFVART